MTAIAIDAGTTVVKAVGYADDGTELATARRPTRVLRPHPGWSEQDMAGVWAQAADATREVAARLPGPPSFLAVTAQGDGAWLVDDHHRPTGHALLWNDGRAADLLTGWERDGTVAEAFGICGSRLSTGMPNAQLAWLRTHDPERIERSSHLLTCGGWLHLRLTGEAVVDASDASAPFLDIRARAWSDRLLQLYGMPWARRLLPAVRDDDHRVTPLSAAAATETGLPRGVPVVFAPYDICATAIGAGGVAAGQGCCILGTTLSTEVVTEEVRTGGEPVGITVALGVPGRYLRAFATMSGSDVLDWGTRTLGLASVSDLMALAARGRQDTAGVRFLPYLSPAGERAPFFDPAARGCLSGLSLHAAPADIARALLEGVTLAIRDCLAASPVTPEVLALCGGGARSEVWTRLVADVTGLPVTVPADSEVGARGAWLAGMVATGREPDIPTAAARYVRTAAMRVPDPRAAEAYAERYDGFLRLRRTCQPAWHGPAGGGGA